MRLFYYRLSLTAGFFFCLFISLFPLKNRSSFAKTVSKTSSSTLSAGSGNLQQNHNKIYCRRLIFEDDSFIICRANPKYDAVHLFLADETGNPLNYFSNVRTMLSKYGERAMFLMNAGMYHKNYSPVGLYVSNNKQLYPASTAYGTGNFFMKPNGVFYIADSKAGIMETKAFLESNIKPQLATQSGPMLVIHNRLHNKFYADSPYREYRNGVGVNKKGEIFFAISEQKVNFNKFARMFRDALHTPNALFLDGSISSIYAPDVKRADWFYPMGPMIGVITKNAETTK